MTENNKHLVQENVARNYVRNNLERMKRAYGERYIAIRRGNIIDSDINEIDLAKRMDTMYSHPHDFILIGTIEDILSPKEIEFSSPEELRWKKSILENKSGH